LEQGFTLAHRPRADRQGEPLVIAVGVTGGLVPAQSADKNSVLFESSKSVVLRYTGLRALDVRGRILPSRLELRGREIRLIVEGHSAQYPLIVDPLWTQQQELTASDGAANDQFGVSVSVSGDTAVIRSFDSARFLGQFGEMGVIQRPAAIRACLLNCGKGDEICLPVASDPIPLLLNSSGITRELYNI
jgi:hypothetical protein